MRDVQKFPARYCLCILIVISLFALTACSTSSPKRPYGSDNQKSYWSRAVAASKSAASDPASWGGALAAAVIGSTSYDERWADRIIKDAPLFSHSEKTSDYTDYLRSLSYIGVITSAAFIPDQSYSDISRRALTEASAFMVTRTTTRLMNENISKEYPNGQGYDSLGSHHAASPFAAAALTRRHVEQLDIPDWGKYTINTGSYLIATGSAWGRIEMGLHYPSDQIASAAIGNFIALFFHDMLLGEVSLPQQTRIELNIHRKYSFLGLNVQF